jgi:hypothetical protein
MLLPTLFQLLYILQPFLAYTNQPKVLIISKVDHYQNSCEENE